MPSNPAHKCACFYASSGVCVFCGARQADRPPTRKPDPFRLPPAESFGTARGKTLNCMPFYVPRSTWGKQQIMRSWREVMPATSEAEFMLQSMLDLLIAMKS